MKKLSDEFGDRVCKLSTGVDGLRATLQVKVTPDDKDPDLLTMRASDDTLDRYDEIIQADGWKLDNYNRNPVIQNCHNYGDVLFTIGKAVRTWIDGQALMQVWKLASQENPIAKVTRDLFKGGFLNASSVGFVPIRWETGSQGSDFRRKYLEQELLEVSAVGIPANPNALAMGVKSGAVEKSDLREMADLLKHFCSDDAGNRANAGAPGSETNGAQLMQLRDFAACVAKEYRAAL
jgi:HK97 family phage prohead protease